MEIGSITRSAGLGPVWPPASRAAEPDTIAAGTRTDLPARAAVTQSPDTATFGEGGRRSDGSASDLERHVIIDPDTRQMVFQAVDGFTGEVVRQTPDKALLRQRAYVIQVEDAKAASDTSKTDLQRRV